MCLTLASLFGLFVCNICTCSICLSAQHVSFLFLLLATAFCFLSVCVSEKIHWKPTVGDMQIFQTMVWVRENILPVTEKMCVHARYVCVGIHMCYECVIPLSLSVCKCVRHAPPEIS